MFKRSRGGEGEGLDGGLIKAAPLELIPRIGVEISFRGSCLSCFVRNRVLFCRRYVVSFWNEFGIAEVKKCWAGFYCEKEISPEILSLGITVGGDWEKHSKIHRVRAIELLSNRRFPSSFDISLFLRLSKLRHIFNIFADFCISFFFSSIYLETNTSKE